MALGARVQFEESSGARSSSVFPALAERLSEAIDRGANYLLSLQASEGYWLGELEADTTLESDYIFYLHVINKARPDRIAKLANYVRRRQIPNICFAPARGLTNWEASRLRILTPGSIWRWWARSAGTWCPPSRPN